MYHILLVISSITDNDECDCARNNLINIHNHVQRRRNVQVHPMNQRSVNTILISTKIVYFDFAGHLRGR